MFNCTECKKKFKTKEGLDSRMKSHKQINCNMCDRTFNRQRQLKKHTRDDHTTKKTPTVENKKCEDCGIIFRRPWLLKKHRQTFHGEPDDESVQKIFKCKHCKVLVQSDAELKKHLKLNHRDVSFGCEVCKSIFFTKKAFYKHKHTEGINTETMDGSKESITEAMNGSKQGITEAMRVLNERVTEEEPTHSPEPNPTEGTIVSNKDNSKESFKVGKRIKQNISKVDLEEANDDDTSYEPPKGIVE